MIQKRPSHTSFLAKAKKKKKRMAANAIAIISKKRANIGKSSYESIEFSEDCNPFVAYIQSENTITHHFPRCAG